MIHIEWWLRSSDDSQWWSRSRDDPDPVMMPHDDPDPVMMPYGDPDWEKIQIRWLEDEDDLKMKMTWILRGPEMQMTRWSSWYREEEQCWKLCRKNTFLVKRECWCICNFGMYSSMYLMYFNPMFISVCFYYVFESCCLTLMFRLRGSIMFQAMLKSP